ncbi:MAG: proton-conducting membrane transporter [Clostridia bacterium]|nr:proton-conducting membrane transporter [Clostridia bacterium]
MLSFFAMIPIMIAIFLYILPSQRIARALAIVTQLGLTCAAFYVFFLSKQGDVITTIGGYAGVLGIILKADTLSSVFLLLTSFIFLVVSVYSFRDRGNKLFWFFLFIWQGLLNGIFLTGDLFNAFILIEVVTVVVAVLIMLNRDNRSMYDGMVYLMINVVAMQFYLFGIGYLYKLTGVLDMNAATQAAQQLDPASLVLPFALMMTAICLKCAFAPLFSWLPNAYGTPGAPSAVSAVLSGLHIKASLYLFIRVQGVFEAVTVPGFFLVIGIVTAVAGFVLAVSQSDVRLILAYSTVSQIGMIVVGLSVADLYANTGSLYHTINHALFKTALFLSAGMITRAYGTRDINRIRGVFRRYPLLGVATMMAVLGITGAPFTNGSISKYFIMSGVTFWMSTLLIFINLGTIIIFIKYSWMLFGHPEPGQKIVKIDGFKQAAALALGIVCLAGGIFGVQLVEFLFGVPMSVDVLGYLEKIALFAVSGVGGFLIYKHYISKSPLFKRIREMEFSFRWMCVSMGAFFAVTLLVVHFFQ